MANYLDNLQTFTNRAQVVIAALAKEMRLLYQAGSDSTDQRNNILWYKILVTGANDTTQDETLRLNLLTLLVDNARLNQVPDPVGVFDVVFTVSPTEINTVPFANITGSPLDNPQLVTEFGKYLLKAGGTMTGPLLIDPATRIDSTGALNIGTSTATTTTIGRTGQNVAMPGTITLATWGGLAIPVALGGLGTLDFASGSNGQVPVKSGAGYAWGNPGLGDFVGPASSTDNAIVRFDGTTGKLGQNSVVSISDAGGIQGAISLSMNGSTSGFTVLIPSAIAGSNTQTLQAATGTVALLQNRLDAFAATTSAQLASVISDETGTGLLVFNNAPTFIAPVLGVATGTSLTVTGALTSGVASSAAGTLVLRNATNAFTQTIRGVGVASSRIFDLPIADPTGTQYLSGTLSGSTVTMAWASITALVNPMDGVGQLIYGGVAGAPTKLAADTSNTRKFVRTLSIAGVAQAPSWDTLVAGDIPTIAQSQVSGLVAALDGKLSDNLPSGQLFVGNLSGLAAPVTATGDWTITDAGVNTIGANKVLFSKFQQATGPQILVGTPDILGAQDFRQITLDPATLAIDALGVMSAIGGGGGTVTNTGNLTANSIVLGNGTVDVKVVTGFTTDGVSKMTLGVAGTSVGGLLLTNATSGTIELRPVTGALGTTVLSLFAGSDTLVGLAATQTLTNKTLTAPQINGALLETSSTVGYVWTATNTTGAGAWAVPATGSTFGYTAKTANYTILITDVVIECTANSFTLTLPTAVGAAGKMYVLKNTGAGIITASTTGGQTIDGSSTQTIATNTSLTVFSTGAAWIIA